MNKEKKIEKLMKFVKNLSKKEQAVFYEFVENIDIIDAIMEENTPEEEIEKYINEAMKERDFTLFLIASYQKQRQERKRKRWKNLK